MQGLQKDVVSFISWSDVVRKAVLGTPAFLKSFFQPNGFIRRLDIGSPVPAPFSVPACSGSWVKFIPPLPGLSFPLVKHATQLNVRGTGAWCKEYHLDWSFTQDLKYLFCISHSLAQQTCSLGYAFLNP